MTWPSMWTFAFPPSSTEPTFLNFLTFAQVLAVDDRPTLGEVWAPGAETERPGRLRPGLFCRRPIFTKQRPPSFDVPFVCDLDRDKRRSSANGAFGRQARHDSAGMRLVTAAPG